jgi:3-isopropylmalate/(R)-2-methylmalate dehydratase small subunit
MQAFTVHTGLVATMDRSNVDTDQIIPKQFLKRIERTGFGQYLFFDWRFHPDGSLRPEFELNAARFRGASVLVARQNFGNGSSREHAVWALDDYGFRAVIAESFADIFFNNCFKNGLLPVTLSAAEVDQLHRNCAARSGYQVTVDLERLEVRDDQGFLARFTVDDFRRKCLLEGLDDIGLTLQHAASIDAYEQRLTPIPARSALPARSASK